jgi:hypothetical protein
MNRLRLLLPAALLLALVASPEVGVTSRKLVRLTFTIVR